MTIKNIFSILMTTTMILSIGSFAQAQENSEMNLAETYTMFCGSKRALIAWAKSKGQKVNKNDLKELAEQRQPLLRVLKDGATAIQQLLDEGSKADTGPFGAIMTCGMLVQIKDEVQQNGCYDLTTNKSVADTGGIAACEQLINQLPN